MKEPLASPGNYQPVPDNRIFPAWERNLKYAALAMVLVVAVVGYRYWKAQQPAPVVTAVRFSPATKWTSAPGLTFSPAFSHSGKLVAYASSREASGTLAIWTQPINSSQATRVTAGDFHETDPDFSPDDRQIVFRSDRDGGGIYIVPVSGGAPRLLASQAWRPRFSPDGKWVAFSRLTGLDDASLAFGAGQIFVVPAGGGESRRIQPDFPFARFPIWAPDSHHLLFNGIRADGAKDWWVTDLDGGKPVRTQALDRLSEKVRMAGMPIQWYGGQVFFSAAEEAHSHIWALPISTSSWLATGAPRRLTDGDGSEQDCAVSPDGRVLYSSVKVDLGIHALPIDTNRAQVTGKLEPVTVPGVRAQLPSIAAGGSKLLYVSNKSGIRDVWIYDLDHKRDERITAFRPIGYRPVISADTKAVVYPTAVSGRCAVVLQAAAQGGRARELQGCYSIWDLSPDGLGMLTFRSNAEMNKVDLIRFPSQEKTVALSHTSKNFYGARFSPDNRWVAFTSGLGSTEAHLFIASLKKLPAPEAEWIQVISDAAGEPAWSPDGNVLYFHSKRDGFHCIWAIKLGADRKPVGEPIPIQHLHSAGLGLYLMKATEFSLAVGKDRLALNLAQDSSDLWMTKLEEKE